MNNDKKGGKMITMKMKERLKYRSIIIDLFELQLELLSARSSRIIQLNFRFTMIDNNNNV